VNEGNESRRHQPALRNPRKLVVDFEDELVGAMN